jgi:type I restriction enzyme, S subunit
MMATQEFRTYKRSECAVFLKTAERFGGLSNMAGGYVLSINGVRVPTSEALYQACRFPHMPGVQKLIIGQTSPMTAKMKSKSYRKDSRPDWDAVRVKIMRWCLHVKLVQHWEKFGNLLLSTGNMPIVEESYRDRFWGAKPIDAETLSGMNVLGSLLVELRERLREPETHRLWIAEPPSLPQFLFLNKPIGMIGCPEAKPVLATVTLFQNSPFAEHALTEEDSERATIADSETEPMKAVSLLTDVETPLNTESVLNDAIPVQGTLPL